MTQDISSRFSCFLAIYVLVVESYIGGSRANWHHTPNPHQGIHNNHTREALPISHDSTRVALFKFPIRNEHKSPIQPMAGVSNNY
jgi:hypothetical protein